VLYYATKHVLPVLSRAFSVQNVDVWKWYNELPLAHLKLQCNPRIGYDFMNYSDALIVNDEISYTLQESSKLQFLNDLDSKTRSKKIQCCNSLNCTTTDCSVFWERFNFEHCHQDDLYLLRKKFDLEF